MKPQLSHSHQTTYEAIFRHPAAHNLQWRDVRSMLGAMAEMVESPDGNIKVTRNGQMLVLRPDHQKDVGTEEQLKELRGFIERSNDALAQSTAVGEGIHLLVVIDHRQARVYKSELPGGDGIAPVRIVPYDPDGSGRHLHYVQNDSNGQRRPELKSYYEAIAKVLRGADAILIFGGGTGASSAMEQLVLELNHHHKDIAARIVGSVVVDEHHLTEDQLLAKAREFYAQSTKPQVAAVNQGGARVRDVQPT